tara:strand:- start:1 stop:273 length:273 start_codon:yes stop_codon:yes gene_type:complete
MLKVYEDLYQISYNNNFLSLTPKEYDVLKILINKSHKLISKNELKKKIWSNKITNSRVVDSCICRIRKKLKELGHPGIYVKFKRGYRLIT